MKLRMVMKWVKARRVGKAKRVLKVSELNKKKEKMEEYRRVEYGERE